MCNYKTRHENVFFITRGAMDGLLLLLRETIGDTDFYKRWDEVAPVYRTEPHDLGLITILVVDQRKVITNEYVRRFPNLKFVVSPTTGHTHLQFNPQECGVELITLRKDPSLIQVRSVAEFTIKQMLELSRPIYRPGWTLSGKTIGIVGYGRIGKQVGELALAFKMNVIAWDKDSTHEQLREILKCSDYISIHLEENMQTRGLISKELINLMKPNSILINTARPSIVDEQALISAIRENRIYGAAMDFEPQCKINDGTLLLVTPHIAGTTVDDRIRTDKIIIARLNQRRQYNTKQSQLQ